MKTNLHILTISLMLALGLASTGAQPSAFTYQGRLVANGNPANGQYDFGFALFDAADNGNVVGSPTILSPVVVSNGLFTVTLDFGPFGFDGANRWLAISVRTNGSIAPYTTLSPLQPITSAPYSIRAGIANAYYGAITDDQLPTNVARLTVPNTTLPASGTPVVVNGFIIDAHVTSGGFGYVSPPAVSVNDSTGSGAVITATVSGGVVTVLSVVNAGSGYSTGASLSIAPPPANDYQVFNSQTFMFNPSNLFQGFFYGNGSQLKNLNASELTNGTVPLARLPASVSLLGQSIDSGEIVNGTIAAVDVNAGTFNTTFWRTSGNAGTTAGTHFIGTTDNQPLEFMVNGMRVLRLEDNGDSTDSNLLPDGAPNIIGGSPVNSVAVGAFSVTISGGGVSNYSGATFPNFVSASDATIGGGVGNTIHGAGATIAGGDENTIQANAHLAAISGGGQNTVNSNAQYAVIGGGYFNEIQTNAAYSTISGGAFNKMRSAYGSIGGGHLNAILQNSPYATIPGGRFNMATNYAFAAGNQALAKHTGSFVWGDSTLADITSTNADSVTMRASGGYRLFSNSGATVGVSLAAGSGSWTSMSDRNAKENFAPVKPGALLDKVLALPVQTWNYKSQDAAIRHIGPMAQDFKAAFGVGETDTGITSVDADGVALAAIQGLNQKLQQELKRRDAENADLKTRLERIEQLLANQKDTQP